MFRKYLAVVWKFWKARISGWLFAVIGLLSLGTSALLTQYHAGQQTLDQVLKWSAGVSLTAAILVILQSQYEAWREEHESRRRTEDELKELESGADLRGEITIYPQDFAPDFVPNP